MKDFRFEGRTAIVTGAGGKPSLGRAHAMLLASRGANVVVNDIGSDPESRGYTGVASAEAVAAEINALGGRAVADTHSVGTVEGATALVETAIEAFGSVDILVNNAAIVAVTQFDELSVRDYERHVQVNLLGPIWTSRAAWPHMRRKGYGRIVNIGSDAFAGMALHTAYSATKGGVFSLTRSLADEGEPLGIRVNTVNPFAHTRMMEQTQQESSAILQLSRSSLPAEMISPLVAYLAHEDCPVTGECFSAAGGSIKRVFLAETEGVVLGEPTIERVAGAWEKIMDEARSKSVRHGFGETRPEDIKPYQASGGPASS
jgi:NAD(P)-dependent dehydrogenase (short-subunit alcohol dehydrogenase family)